MLPGIRRPTKKQYIAEAAGLLARLAMGAADGDRRGSRFPPSALRTATYVGNAVGEAKDDPELGPEYSATFGHGATVEELFAAAASKLESALVQAGHEVLAEFYLRIQEDLAALAATKGSAATPAEVAKIVADVLVRDVDEASADGDGVSLWVVFMQACYPDSPQLLLALRKDPHADSSANAFAPWQKVPGTF